MVRATPRVPAELLVKPEPGPAASQVRAKTLPLLPVCTGVKLKFVPRQTFETGAPVVLRTSALFTVIVTGVLVLSQFVVGFTTET